MRQEKRGNEGNSSRESRRAKRATYLGFQASGLDHNPDRRRPGLTCFVSVFFFFFPASRIKKENRKLLVLEF